MKKTRIAFAIAAFVVAIGGAAFTKANSMHKINSYYYLDTNSNSCQFISNTDPCPTGTQNQCTFSPDGVNTFDVYLAGSQSNCQTLVKYNP